MLKAKRWVVKREFEVSMGTERQIRQCAPKLCWCKRWWVTRHYSREEIDLSTVGAVHVMRCKHLHDVESRSTNFHA